MKFTKFKIFRKPRFIALTLAACFCISTLAFSANFNDVPSTHSAYNAIQRVTSAGIMSGDASNNFKPNEQLDKFETAKILAKASGYKYTNVTAAEQAVYDAAYKEYKDFLALFAKASTKWNSSADKEIAYLLKKGIITETELNQFVIIDTSGAQKLTSLRKYEAAMFIVRVMGKESAALSGTYTYNYSDNASIPETARKYVYYLKNAGITSASGAFSPNENVTKATMATLLNNMLNVTNTSPTPTPTATQAPSPTPASSTATKVIETISGTIDKLFPSMNAVQLIVSDKKTIYPLSLTATVYVDGYKRTFADLKENMTVIAQKSNGELIDVKATSPSSATPTPTPTATPAPPTSTATPVTTTPVPTPMSTPTPIPTTPPVLTEVFGTISAVSVSNNTVTVEIRFLNPRNEIITQVNTYTIASSSVISKSGAGIYLYDIAVGDVVAAKVSGNIAYAMEIEDKDLIIKDGTLVDKKYSMAYQSPMLSIRNSSGKIYDLVITEKTSMQRQDKTITSWESLRIGDTIDITAEYEKLLSIKASGKTSTLDGLVEEIYLSVSKQTVTIKKDDGTLSTHPLIMSSVDGYNLRVGSTVRLQLDSLEVSNFQVLQTVTASGGQKYTGYICALKSSSFGVMDKDYTVIANDITIDSKTVITDAATGNKLTYSNLRTYDKVYVVLDPDKTNVAKTITVLVEF